MEEVWKDIPGYEGRYQVSDQGRVRSLAWTENVANKWGGTNTRRTAPCCMALQVGDKGRVFVSITKNKKPRRFIVAKLVAAAFIGPRPSGLLVLHNDGNNQNNVSDNLRYGNQKENMEDARAHGTISKGESRYNAKLTLADVVRIRLSTKTGASLAKLFNVTPQCVSLIRSKKNWATP